MAFHFLLDRVCQEARNVPSIAHIVYCAVAMDRLHHTHFTCSHLLLLYLNANVSCQEARCVKPSVDFWNLASWQMGK